MRKLEGLTSSLHAIVALFLGVVIMSQLLKGRNGAELYMSASRACQRTAMTFGVLGIRAENKARQIMETSRL